MPAETVTTLDWILTQVSLASGVPYGRLRGSSRNMFHVENRWAFMLLAHNAGATDRAIGAFLYRHPDTIRHGIDQAGKLLQENREFARLVLDIERERQLIGKSPTQKPKTTLLPMEVSRPSRGHKLNSSVVADAARRFTALLEDLRTSRNMTEYEMLVFLRETGAHCMGHYKQLRILRRMRGDEADPYNDESSFEAWLSVEEFNHERLPQARRTHPARNRRSPSPVLEAV